jgi:hypothetical protein
MRVDEQAPKAGRVSPAAPRGGGRSELAGLRATCRGPALTATNTDLRSQNDRLTPTRDTVGLEVEDRGAGA